MDPTFIPPYKLPNLGIDLTNCTEEQKNRIKLLESHFELLSDSVPPATLDSDTWVFLDAWLINKNAPYILLGDCVWLYLYKNGIANYVKPLNSNKQVMLKQYFRCDIIVRWKSHPSNLKCPCLEIHPISKTYYHMGHHQKKTISIISKIPIELTGSVVWIVPLK